MKRFNTTLSDALDPGGFGTVTITKNITIDGSPTGTAGILSAGTNGVNVNDSATGTPNTIVVVLRGLTINGAGTGVNGVSFTSGKALHVENCRILGVTNHGISLSTTVAVQLFVNNTTITECTQAGINSTTTGASRSAISVVDSRLERNGIGLRAQQHAEVLISHSSVATNNTLANSGGIIADSSLGDVFVTVESCFIAYNTVGVQAGTGAATVVRISNCNITGNGTGVQSTGGGIVSSQNNTILGNTANGSPTSTIPQV
ncbi:MAG: hypothetical protein LC754_08495 [Acidobacteria bacterium]|nr:hypothetical protein [Acidobacteriota bacterium]